MIAQLNRSMRSPINPLRCRHMWLAGTFGTSNIPLKRSNMRFLAAQIIEKNGGIFRHAMVDCRRLIIIFSSSVLSRWPFSQVVALSQSFASRSLDLSYDPHDPNMPTIAHPDSGLLSLEGIKRMRQFRDMNLC